MYTHLLGDLLGLLSTLGGGGLLHFHIISAYCLFAKSSKAVWIVSITYGGSNHFDGVLDLSRGGFDGGVVVGAKR
jgi:hypothetical protein